MKRKRNKLYVILTIACFAGYLWLYFMMSKHSVANQPLEVCFVKHLTNIPCPSCGSTRSVISLVKGNFLAALNINPIGYIIAIIMLISPVWIFFDSIFRSNSLFNFYQKMESYFKKPSYAIPFILLVMINWIWNITKGL